MECAYLVLLNPKSLDIAAIIGWHCFTYLYNSTLYRIFNIKCSNSNIRDVYYDAFLFNYNCNYNYNYNYYYDFDFDYDDDDDDDDDA